VLYPIVAVFLILWLLGITLNIAGSSIHVLLVIAVGVVVANFVIRRARAS